MAKATITIEDIENVEDKENATINISYDFIPELPTNNEDPDVIESDTLTPAQNMAMQIYDMIQNSQAALRAENSGEEKEANCEQTEEGTCCGGACHPTTEG